jgi:hypothetical protein
MRYLLLILILLCSCQLFFGYRTSFKHSYFVSQNIQAQDDSGLFICEVPIEAFTDMQKWTDYLINQSGLDSLSTDTIPAGCYTTIAAFVIDTSGKIINVSIKKDPGYGFGRRVAEAIAAYKGKWHPAEMHGKATQSYRTQPVTIIVEEEEKEEECNEQLPAGSLL